MNYGKSNLSRRKKQISSKKKRKKKRVGVRFFKALIICFLLLIVIGAAGIGIYVTFDRHWGSRNWHICKKSD